MAQRTKPTLLKLISGNPGRRPLNMNEPQPVGRLGSRAGLDDSIAKRRLGGLTESALR